MKRPVFLAAAAGAAAAAALPRIASAQADVVLKTATGNIYGTLVVPQAVTPPLVILHAGSGPTDRNGNSPLLPGKIDTLRMLADALAQRGIASLRYDKRGIAASAAAMVAERDLRFDTYVDDLVAWVAQVRAQSRFARVTLAGHSEGALIAMLAAQRAPVDAYASLEGAGRTLQAILHVQLRALPLELRADAYRLLDELAAGQADADVPPELVSLFRPSVQPYLISEFRYDPVREIAKLRIPTLIVQGTADVQVPPADGGELLRAAAPRARYLLVEGMNHVLKHAPDTSTPQAIQAGYTDPALPLEPAVVEALGALAANP